MTPSNAVAAASHTDPYPYYRDLLAGPDLAWDAGPKLWLASRAAVIREVMANPACVVRPAAEPVPNAISGSSAGEIFSRLVRMNEGAGHTGPRRALGQFLAALDLDAVARRTAQLAPMLGSVEGDAITRWSFDLPTFVVADLLGVDQPDLPQLAREVADFVRCLSPLSTPVQLASASEAARALMHRFAAPRLGSMLPDSAGLGQDVVVANLIGLLSQTHEATAGLIGNSIVALLSRSALQARLRGDPSLARSFVCEVARYDPAVQNTRRFVAQATTVAGVALQPGDSILLLLGAAARDDHDCAMADSFMLERAQGELPGFGHARHACPGQQLALTIATGAIGHLLAQPRALDPAALCWRYAPSANARLPQFMTAPTKGQP